MDKILKMRELSCKLETREAPDGAKHIVGLLPYNQMSVDLSGGYGYFEVITPTAFNKSLADRADVKALVAHDSAKILGRVANGMFILESIPEGLRCDIAIGNQSYALDLYESVKRGDVTTMSFGFYIDQEDVSYDEGQKTEVHYLRSVALLEVSFGVVFPAYPQTDSEARSRRMSQDHTDAKPGSVLKRALREMHDEQRAVRTIEEATSTAAYTNVLAEALRGERQTIL